ncbi:MAG TPA: DUF2723 domain-containing protein, partial [Bacteroidota bacterium]|nr:DUF2723 domain-containing protein [Bacteroidota bacterium]
MGFLKRPAGAAVLTGLAAFALFRATVAPGIGFIDSGELSTVACSLGIAHPTGYPLYTLVGWIFSRLPLSGTEIARLNIMAAVLCSASVGFLLLVFRRVILHCVRGHAAGPYATVSAAAGALMLAFSATFWSQALEVEVYPLHLLLVSIVLLTFLRSSYPLPGESPGAREWYLFAYAVGLAFTNHMTTVLLAPGLLYLYFAGHGGSRRSWNRLLKMALPFLAGLSVYIYIPLRASGGPELNWGYPVTLERFLWHVTGKQYQVWMFSSLDVVGRQISYFINDLPGEFGYAGLLLAAAGSVALWRGNRRLAAGVALLFCVCVGYAANYDIHDIDSYFLLAYICTAMAAAVGLSSLAGAVSSRFPRAGYLIGAVILSSAALPLVSHFRDADESGDHLVEDYTKNMFSSLRPGAVVFSYQWDYWVSASYYYQIVEGVRPDVTVIDKELLRRSWYLRELEHRRPWLIASSRIEVNAFLAQVDLFEHGLPYDPAAIQAKYVGMIESFIRRSMSARPVYVTGEIEPEFTRGLFRVPEGLAFRLTPVQGEIPSPLPSITARAFARRGRLEDMIHKLYADAFLA